jgi:enoyl reductase-like protein
MCDQVFDKAQSLGGHTSKVHRNKSTKYQQMLKRREERAMEREVNKVIKVYFQQEKSMTYSQHRQRVTKLKKGIRSYNGRFGNEPFDKVGAEMYLRQQLSAGIPQ